MVDDGYEDILSGPGYYVIMTDSERAELEEIGRRSSQSDSNAEMNCTFIIGILNLTFKRHLMFV